MKKVVSPDPDDRRVTTSPDHKAILLALISISFCFAQTFPPLPEFNTGIASHYPNDAGIFSDTSVIFADDFESYTDASGLAAKWNGGVYHNVRIATEPGHVFAGSKSVRP